MPKMVTIERNPAYKPKTEDDKKVLASIKPRQVPYIGAMEAITNSGGMYRIKTEAEKTAAPTVMNLEDMSIDQLKVMMLTAGVTTDKKKMAKADIIMLIRKKLAEIEVDDPEPDAS